METLTFGAPAMITWQLTRDCNLACLHCCTDSAPGRALPNELSRIEALRIADEIIHARVPKVMLVGGEPTLVPHFIELAEKLGRAGILIKIETNGQAFSSEHVRLLKELPIFSIQISLDGDTPDVYKQMRPGGRLESAHRACRAVQSAGMPLEVTFAPTRINLSEAEPVIDRAASFGAFRFNTGMLMRLGTAARLWSRLEPSREQYSRFIRILRRKETEFNGRMQLSFRPWSLMKALKASAASPSATLLVLPDGKVKISAGLPYLCADLRSDGLIEAWKKYQRAWMDPRIAEEILKIAQEPERFGRANSWTWLNEASDMAGSVVNPDRLTKSQAGYGWA